MFSYTIAQRVCACTTNVVLYARTPPPPPPPHNNDRTECVIIVAVTEGLVREEQLLHDMCLLSATTVEITQILTRAGPEGLKYI